MTPDSHDEFAEDAAARRKTYGVLSKIRWRELLVDLDDETAGLLVEWDEAHLKARAAWTSFKDALLRPAAYKAEKQRYYALSDAETLIAEAIVDRLAARGLIEEVGFGGFDTEDLA